MYVCVRPLQMVARSDSAIEGLSTVEKKGRWIRQVLRGVKCCTSTLCRESMLRRCENKTVPWVANRGRMWNRDVNAARNMLLIYEHMMNTGQRIHQFSRSRQSDVEDQIISVADVVEDMVEESEVEVT